MPTFPRLHRSGGAATRRITPAVALVGLAGTAVLTLGLGASLSGLVATITNSQNTVASAALAIQETAGAAQCNSYDTTTSCGTINKYGGTTTPLVPGGSQTTTITMKNAGTVNAATSTLAPSACEATSTGVTGSQTPTTPNTTAGNICSVLQVAVYKAATATGTPLYTGSAANFTASLTLGALNANATQAFTFVVTLPTTATTATQGQQASQVLTWTYNQ